MPRFIGLGALIVALGGLAGDALASGSVGPGATNLSGQGAYSVGKALVFRTMACRTCPMQRQDFDRARARSLKGNLVAVLEDGAGGWDDRSVQALCDVGIRGSARCDERVRSVLTYLDRRYRL